MGRGEMRGCARQQGKHGLFWGAMGKQWGEHVAEGAATCPAAMEGQGWLEKEVFRHDTEALGLHALKIKICKRLRSWEKFVWCWWQFWPSHALLWWVSGTFSPEPRTLQYVLELPSRVPVPESGRAHGTSRLYFTDEESKITGGYMTCLLMVSIKNLKSVFQSVLKFVLTLLDLTETMKIL